MQRQPTRHHGKAADIQIDLILAPDDIHQIASGLPGWDRHRGQVLLLPEQALFNFAGAFGHVASLGWSWPGRTAMVPSRWLSRGPSLEPCSTIPEPLMI